jgi:hypothetical protein
VIEVLANSRVMGVHCDLILCSITNQPLGVGERYVGGRRAVTLVVRNNFYTIILPDTDAAREKMSIRLPKRKTVTKKLTSR